MRKGINKKIQERTVGLIGAESVDNFATKELLLLVLVELEERP